MKPSQEARRARCNGRRYINLLTYLLTGRVALRHLEAVERDRRDADGRDEDVGAGAHRHELAHEPAEPPVGHQHLEQVERLREEAERQVGDGEVDDEDVARRPHRGVARHDEADQTVAGRAERDQQREQSYQNHLWRPKQRLRISTYVE